VLGECRVASALARIITFSCDTGAIFNRPAFAEVALRRRTRETVTVAAERLHRAIAGLERGVGSAQLCGVGLGAARFAIVGTAMPPWSIHEFRRFQLRVRIGERMRDRLVLSDRTAEDDAFLCVPDCFRDGGAADSDRFGGDQGCAQDSTRRAGNGKPAAFTADQIGGRHFQIVDEQ